MPMHKADNWHKIFNFVLNPKTILAFKFPWTFVGYSPSVSLVTWLQFIKVSHDCNNFPWKTFDTPINRSILMVAHCNIRVPETESDQFLYLVNSF